jgi:hypothetical protein
LLIVIPAKREAREPGSSLSCPNWIPAFAGMTRRLSLVLNSLSTVMAHFTWAIQGNKRQCLVTLDGPGKLVDGQSG